MSQFINLLDSKRQMLASTMNKLKRNYSNPSHYIVSHRSSVNQKQQSLINKLQMSPQNKRQKIHQSTQNLMKSSSSMIPINPSSHIQIRQSHSRHTSQQIVNTQTNAISVQQNINIKNIPTSISNTKDNQFQSIKKSLIDNSNQISTNNSKGTNINQIDNMRDIIPFNLSQTDRTKLSKTNSNKHLIMSNNQQQIQIINLQSKLSCIFNQKCQLQVKLNQSQKQKGYLIDQNNKLKFQIQHINSSKSQSQSNSQNQYIIQLLQEYQNTKKMIQNLIYDNQILSKKNDKLKQDMLKVSTNQQITKLKQYVRIIQKQNKQLQKAINNYQYEIIRVKQDNAQKSLQINQLKITNTQSIQVNNIKQLQSTRNNLVLKQKQIEQLKQQLQLMNYKFKQVLNQISKYSQIFETEKVSLRNQYQEYKLSSAKQIQQLRSMIPTYNAITVQNNKNAQITTDGIQNTVHTLFMERDNQNIIIK